MSIDRIECVKINKQDFGKEINVKKLWETKSKDKLKEFGFVLTAKPRITTLKDGDVIKNSFPYIIEQHLDNKVRKTKNINEWYYLVEYDLSIINDDTILFEDHNENIESIEIACCIKNNHAIMIDKVQPLYVSHDGKYIPNQYLVDLIVSTEHLDEVDLELLNNEIKGYLKNTASDKLMKYDIPYNDTKVISAILTKYTSNDDMVHPINYDQYLNANIDNHIDDIKVANATLLSERLLPHGVGQVIINESNMGWLMKNYTVYIQTCNTFKVFLSGNRDNKADEFHMKNMIKDISMQILITVSSKNLHKHDKTDCHGLYNMFGKTMLLHKKCPQIIILPPSIELRDNTALVESKGNWLNVLEHVTLKEEDEVNNSYLRRYIGRALRYIHSSEDTFSTKYTQSSVKPLVIQSSDDAYAFFSLGYYLFGQGNFTKQELEELLKRITLIVPVIKQGRSIKELQTDEIKQFMNYIKEFNAFDDSKLIDKINIQKVLVDYYIIDSSKSFDRYYPDIHINLY